MNRLARALPALLLAAQLAAVFGALLDPGRALATRDLPQFHLPLRASLAAALGAGAEGVPEWNPAIQGGQPLASDPSYSLFYPPTWLVLLRPAPEALGWIVLLHVALAAAGAYRLTRRLGCRPESALLAASGFAGGGAFVSLVHAYTLLPATAWLPWAIDAADRARLAPDWRAACRPVAATAAVIALVALNGEPATLLATALAVVATATLGRPVRPLRALAAGALAIALAAIQLLPALARLAASARGDGLELERAARWSMSPLRLAELVLPRLFGDPARLDEGLYFGWGIHDLDYPYLLLLTPGLALVVIGFAALATRPLPRRALWATLLLGGVLLALGRHTPLFALAAEVVPGLAAVRYPEKFFLLTHAALAFAGALGWERLLAARARGERSEAELPLALAALALALATAFAAAVHLAPERVEDFVVAHAGLAPTAEALARAVDLYRADARAALAIALGLTALLGALRASARLPARAALLAAWGLLAAELLRLTPGLVGTLPAAVYREPPALARALVARAPLRLWSSADVDLRPELVLRGDGRPPNSQRARIERLDPSVGVLWGFRYALSVDFALTLTPPARRARLELERLWRERRRDLVHRLLGAWSVDTILVRRGPRELFLASRAGEETPLLPATLAANPRALPWARTVPVASLHPDGDAALAAAIATGLPLGEREFLVTGERGAELRFDPAARVVAAREAGDRIEVEVAARGPALLVVATTHDPGWSAARGGEALSVLQSGAGYLAVPLPPGGGTVRLVYRDPWLRPGAAVSGAALVALLGLAFARRRPKPAPAAP